MREKGQKMKKTIQNGLYKYFTGKVLNWNRNKNKRQMPWKGETDPYKIWLSEIILQQTRVDQGLSYYHKFIESYPTVHQLAKAADNKVFKLWEGLGYYNRCRNLISTARYISKKRKGKFPESYIELKNLKGIGPYTAAAIASFAFNLPHAVVDGNVYRVLSRIFGINTPIDSVRGKKILAECADQLLDKQQPGIYNQAIMDFGAVVCKPLTPLCTNCPFKKICFAFNNSRINSLPVKRKKVKIKKRYFYYLVLNHKKVIIIRQRREKDIWQDLYEFPMIESDFEHSTSAILQLAEEKGWIKKKKYCVNKISPVFKQQLSHQLIIARFLQIQLLAPRMNNINNIGIKKTLLNKFAVPGIINNYLKKTNTD